MDKSISNNKKAFLYSVITVVCTFILGGIIFVIAPEKSNTTASILFILLNLIPMIMAFIFTYQSKEVNGLWQFLEKVFYGEERSIVWLFVLLVPVVYYGVSVLLGNVKLTGMALGAVIAYFPWTLFQGGLEEVGWRWYLQEHLQCKNFILKMFVISIIWFVWHLPIYRLPWITAGSTNYLLFYLMILGNTFMLGTIKEFSKGAIPCVLAHMLIDSLAILMLVKSTFIPLVILVVIEVILSISATYFLKDKNMNA